MLAELYFSWRLFFVLRNRTTIRDAVNINSFIKEEDI